MTEPFITVEYTPATSVNNLLPLTEEEANEQTPYAVTPVDVTELTMDFTDRLLHSLDTRDRLDVLESGIISQLGVEAFNRLVAQVEESYTNNQ